MGAGISVLVTTQGVATCQPQPLIMGAAFMLGFAIPSRPLPLITGVVLVVAIDSISRPLFTYPFATATQPSSSMAFRTSTTCLCPWLPTGSNFNSAKWPSI